MNYSQYPQQHYIFSIHQTDPFTALTLHCQHPKEYPEPEKKKKKVHVTLKGEHVLLFGIYIPPIFGFASHYCLFFQLLKL